MARVELQGKQEARRAALDSIDQLENRIARNISNLIHDIDGFIKSVTPVNTGQAVRNYIWSMNSPFMGTFDAIDNGPPGPTNSMALGSEPRRQVNESAAAESISSLDLRNPFGVIYLTNNSPDIVGLEMGLLPGPPLKSRSPQGMFGITQAHFNAQVRARGITR